MSGATAGDRLRCSGFTLSGPWQPPCTVLTFAEHVDLPADGSAGQYALRGNTVYVHDGAGWVGHDRERVAR